MKQYSAEVTWLVPEFVTLTVRAATPKEAIEKALKEVARDPNRYVRTLDYDTCRPDVVTGLWEGPEAYADARELDLPRTPTQTLEAAIAAVVQQARAGAAAPPEIHALIEAFEAWREAR